ncbi:MAG: hypothetical protein HQ483_01755 [Rhodospirillales bacterium]|nr:hypothetical protein [Rhodospirillales bacterium]
MTWPNNAQTRVCLAGLLGLLSACADIQYIDHASNRTMDQATDDSSAFSRTVDFHLDPAFYETPPRCVMILPVHHKKAPDRRTAELVEDAVSRYASNRFDKALTARHVKFAARKRAFDPGHAGDRRRLGRALRCDTQLEIRTVGVEDLYAIVWADKSVTIQLTLTRTSDGAVLWRGRHTARRADGGLPIGFLGVGAGTFSAGMLASDSDILPSMIDDAVRRVMASLPDTRHF